MSVDLDVKLKNLIGLYLDARDQLLKSDYWRDIAWAEDINIDNMDRDGFFSECAWVIFNSGFRASTVTKFWPEMRIAFRYFSVKDVLKDTQRASDAALRIFGHKGKVAAVITVAHQIDALGWPLIKESTLKHGP